MMMCAAGELSVVVVVGAIVVTVVEPIVVLTPKHGQSSVTSWPTAFFKQMSASVAVVGSDPFGAQIHGGRQISECTAVRRMKRQSLAVGLAPFVTG
jgi:hypothetical protein